MRNLGQATENNVCVEYLLKLLLSGNIELLEDTSFSKIQSTETVLNNKT